MKAKAIAVSILALIVSACASTTTSRPEQGTGVPSTFHPETEIVEEIRSLKPQAQPPLKVAVMPPARSDYFSHGERDVIAKWGERLKALGFVSAVEIVPSSLAPNCSYKRDSTCYLRESRAAAARMGADTILFLDDSTVTEAYINPLSILNLTIVGLWIAPAHHRDSYSVYEAALFDINNGYLYAVAQGQGEHKMLRPFIYVGSETGQKEARVRALDDVGRRLYEMARNYMTKTRSPD